MTSGNLSEEPIVTANSEAHRVLAPIADTILTHDRGIFMRVDDSVARVIEGVPRVLRARGYAPGALELPFEAEDVLGAGAELKNTLCITKSRYAIMSQHIGDLENVETLAFFEETLANLRRVYRADPRLVAHDLHPDYLSTRWALARPEPKLAVQHHHAHVASCMAENGIDERVIGVAFDGTGYGLDGQIWGGEFLVCDYHGFKRAAHLRYVPLIGGDRAARESWRMAAAYLFDALGPDCFRLELPCWREAPPTTLKIIERLLSRPARMTSSCGRLFDAIASLCGISQTNSYEGESAILLEAAASSVENRAYTYHVSDGAFPWIIDLRPMVRQITNDLRAGLSTRAIAHYFHETTANMITAVCGKLREGTGVNRVCLSGGSFQNVMLLTRAAGLLRQGGFEVLLHSQAPPNDGGISLGQAAIAAAHLRKGS
jgi:hydrogenase maturation protein HypF